MDLIDREKALGCFWAYEDGDETEMPAYDRLQALPIVAEVEDCISRQAALGYIDRVLTIGTGKHKSLEFIRKYIETLPSAETEIIRCKDCLMHGVCRFEQGLGLDGYCSQAERRTDG